MRSSKSFRVMMPQLLLQVSLRLKALRVKLKSIKDLRQRRTMMMKLQSRSQNLRRKLQLRRVPSK